MPKLALLAPVVAIVMFMADAPAIGADTPDTPALLAKSLEQLSALQGFSCDFEQTLSFSDGSEQHYAGTLDVLRPRRFRWHYKLPYEQLYISDGDIIWHYEPDLLQAEVLEGLDAVDPVVMKLLDGRIGGRDVLLLAQEQPQEEPQITRYQVQIGEGPAMWLGIRSDARLAYIESLDVMDNRNRITLNRFSHVAPQSELFRFTPPEGVDVIGAAFGVVAAEE
ncbi:MAG: outer membrane lipoprotein carrier protein LolA [Mariprofundaceae bacterium]